MGNSGHQESFQTHELFKKKSYYWAGLLASAEDDGESSEIENIFPAELVPHCILRCLALRLWIKSSAKASFMSGRDKGSVEIAGGIIIYLLHQGLILMESF